MSWTTKASALLAVAASGLVLYLTLSNSTSTARAFADVAEALNNVHSATWKFTEVVKGPQSQSIEKTGIGMFVAPSHERKEINGAAGVKVIQVIDGQKDKVITLVPAMKTAMIINFKNSSSVNHLGKTFQDLRQIVAKAQNGKTFKVERLEDQTIDGRTALGFRLQTGLSEMKIWSDPKTLLPIRVEQAMTVPGGPEGHIAMTDFNVDVHLDESLFSVDVPEGYTITQTSEVDISKKPIVYLAEMLEMAAKQNDGVFPPALRAVDIENTARRAEETFAQTHNDSETSKFAYDTLMKVSTAFAQLYMLSPDENDWHYAGKDVRLNTPDRPIFWYRTSKSSTRYQVLYADLSVREVSSEEALKAPHSEGSPKP